MNPRFSLLAFLVLLVGSACASRRIINTHPFAAAPCAGLDWFEIGRRDGALGKPLNALNDHIKRCSLGVAPDTDLYVNGRNAGLVEFCTTQNGFEVGRAGTPYSAVCPENLEKKFLPGYEQGRRVHLQDNEGTSKVQL